MEECIFCKIASGQIPAEKIHEDAHAMAFYDIAPQAPVHVLVIPKVHTPNAAACAKSDPALLGELFALAARLSGQLGLEEGGFRLVTNCGRDGAQSVDHLHIHILGGAALNPRLG